ncbi:MAG: hypothetical protein AAF495_00690 [Pseudomonadota bacterium]
MLGNMTREDFAAHLNETFRIDFGSDVPGLESFELSLIEAEPLKTPQLTPESRPPFALLFRGPKEPVLNQSIYPLENEAMGRLDIFLVPIGPDAEGQRYEAVFN